MRKSLKQLDCDAVIFDLDGVLVDSTACIERHWRQWAAGHGLDVEKVLHVAHGRRTVETIRLVAPHLEVERQAAQFEAQEASDTEGVVEVQGAARMLRSLPGNRWAVATSGSRDTATNRISHSGIPMPGVLVTASDVTRGKPDPEAYLRAAHLLGVDPARCVVVEDAPAGIQAAQAAGMRAIGLATSRSMEELAGADVIAARLGDIHITKNSQPPAGSLTIRVGKV